MANRLLCRFTHLLCRSSSQAPATAAVRLLLPVVGPAAVSRPKGWSRITERLMCNSTALCKISYPRIPPKSPLEELVEKAEAPEDILSAWEKHGKRPNEAAWTLTKWTYLMVKTRGKFTKYDPELLSDSRLKNMMKTLTQKISLVFNSSLVTVLQTFWILKVPSTHPTFSSVHSEVLWRLRRLSVKHLAILVFSGTVRGVQDTELSNLALKQLELRWIEIKDAQTVAMLLSAGQSLSPYLVDKLEDKALELAESLSTEDIRHICKSLAVQNRRSVSLLRAMSYHLLQKPSVEFTTPLIMDLAFAYAKLNFHNSQLFQRLSHELLPRVPELRPFEVTHYAKSLGFLKWLHIPLFEAFAEHYTENSQKYNLFQLCNLLMTFARVAFQPKKGEQFYSKVHDVMEESLADLEPFLRTDVAWSLCVLKQAKPHYLIPLCQQSHLTKMSESKPSYVETYKLKLQHIAATLLLEHPGSSSIVLPIPASSSDPSELQISLREALQSLVGGKTESLRTGVNTVYGWTIDGEMVVDCDNKPIDMSTLKAPHLPSGGGDQNLPAGTRRLAFVAWEYPDFGSKGRELLGFQVMKKRHLQLAGFITVEVPYYEWLEMKTDWQKLAYLKDKIGKAVAEDMAK